MKRFWTIYFWLYLVFTILLITYYLFGEIQDLYPSILGRVISYILMLIPVLGLYGLAYRKRFLHHIFWKIYFIFAVISFIRGVFYTNEGMVTFSISTPLQFITIVGLFIYAFMQNKLFGKNDYKGSDLNFKLSREI